MGNVSPRKSKAIYGALAMLIFAGITAVILVSIFAIPESNDATPFQNFSKKVKSELKNPFDISSSTSSSLKVPIVPVE